MPATTRRGGPVACPGCGAETSVPREVPGRPLVCGSCGTAFFVEMRRERRRGGGSHRLRTSSLVRCHAGVPRPSRPRLRRACLVLAALMALGFASLLAARHRGAVAGASRRAWRVLRPVLDEGPLLPAER